MRIHHVLVLNVLFVCHAGSHRAGEHTAKSSRICRPCCYKAQVLPRVSLHSTHALRFQLGYAGSSDCRISILCPNGVQPLSRSASSSIRFAPAAHLWASKSIRLNFIAADYWFMPQMHNSGYAYYSVSPLPAHKLRSFLPHSLTYE